MAPTAGTEPNSSHTFMLDARTGEALEMPSANGGFMMFMLRLHVDMFAGLPGKLLLASMGILFVMAIISGTVLYLPFMRRLKFGTVRQDKIHPPALARPAQPDRRRDPDLGPGGGRDRGHQCLRRLADRRLAQRQPQRDDRPVPRRTAADTIGARDRLLDIANEVAPDMQPDFIAFPGTRFSSEHHYAVFMKGSTHLTSHLLTPVLIDASTLHVTAVAERPWYMDAMGMSQPLHFGDYGGMPMKILWATLDVLTIIVLGSGVYLWLVRRKTAKPLLEKAESVA